jgi:hypothetical protein
VNEALRENMCILTQRVEQNHVVLQEVLQLLKNLSPTIPAQILQDSSAPAASAPTISFEILNNTQDTSSPSRVFLTWFKYDLPGAFHAEKSSTKNRTDFCRYKSLVRVYLKYGCVNGNQYPGMMPSNSDAINKWASNLQLIIIQAESNLLNIVKGEKITKTAIYRIHDSDDFQTRPYPPNCPLNLTDIDEEMSKRGSKKRKVSEPVV